MGVIKQRSYFLLLLLFAMSGFSGLVYESVWTHYLKLFLGHAAYAQMLVLAIFMGGMAFGAFLCSRRSLGWSNLLRGYAVVEMAVAVAAFLFHPAYCAFVDVSYTHVIPGLKTAAAINIYKWGGACLLILLPSVLLGMTFPLMTSGVIRRFPEKPGRAIAALYFVNSIGAAAGVLVSGFVLVHKFGLPGALCAAGIINVIVAIGAWQLGGPSAGPVSPVERGEEPVSSRLKGHWAVMMAVAAATGAASFAYEIGWIRMLSLVLGSSTHAFELMLSAFIGGLAFGGLWIRRSIDRLKEPIVHLAWIQVIMGVCAMATVPVYSGSFGVMARLVNVLPRTDAGYFLFNLGSHAIALAVMLPATFCAGMTLPLVTISLLRRNYGERSVGAVYSSNTIGAIVGVFASAYFLLPAVGVKGVIAAGASLDIAIGAALAWYAAASKKTAAAMTAVPFALLFMVVAFASVAPHRMASGVYRHGRLLDPTNVEVRYHRDGRTATVSLTEENNGKLSLRTNGKTDGSIAMRGPLEAEDEHTMILVGALALSLHPEAGTAANIGMGTGLTTHTMLCTPQLSRLDTIEIEPFMVEAARQFGSRVERAFNDPRSSIHIEDAKIFFAAGNTRYDIIVSEPSNPWVSGVATLFSDQFYQQAVRSLEPEGIFLQWLQLYDIDLDLVMTVVGAIARNFDDYQIYAANTGDAIIVARPKGNVPTIPDAGVLAVPGLAAELKRIGVKSPADLMLRRVAGRRSFQPLVESSGVPPNSDFYPVLDHGAARARFMGLSACELIEPSFKRVPIVEMLEGAPAPQMPAGGFEASSYVPAAVQAVLANSLLDYLGGADWSWPYTHIQVPENIRQYADMAREAVNASEGRTATDRWWNGMFNCVAKRVVGFVSPDRVDLLLDKVVADGRTPELDSTQLAFVAALKARSRLDAPALAASSAKILADMQSADSSFVAYNLANAMTAYIAMDKPEDALLLWQAYSPALSRQDSETLVFRILLAHTREHAAGSARMGEKKQ